MLELPKSCPHPRSGSRAAGGLALAAAIAFPCLHVHAESTGATFEVMLSMTTSAPTNSATCSTSATQGIATVACSTPSYRFLTNVRRDDGTSTTDGYAGATSTALRLVSLANRQYIEMTVGW